MTSTLYPPLRIRDIPGPQPGQFGVLEKPHRPQKNLVLQNRELEAIREAREQLNREAKTELNKINFNDRSNKRAFQADVRREVERRLNQNEILLEERRERLRQLLANEEAQYLEEATGSRETPAERIALMRQKANRIREEKESEHARIVQEKYDQRFRRDCAELRELQSRELDQEIGHEQMWQIREKMDRKKNQQAEEEFWTKLWYDDIRKKEEREQRDFQQAKNKSDAMAKTIREQIQAVEQEKFANKSKRKEYSEAAWAQFRAQKEEKLAEYKEKLRKQDENRNLLDTVLATKIKIQQRKAEEEKALDEKLAEETQSATVSDEIEREKRKNELKEEGQRYRAYLEQRKLDEARQNEALEKAVQIELNRQNAMQAAKKRAEQEKRDKLLKEVLAGRQEQLSIQKDKKAQQLLENQWQKDMIKRITEDGLADDAARATRSKEQQVVYRRHLFGQMDYERRKKEEEQYEIQREQADGFQAEIEYQKKLNFELQQTGVSNPHPIRQWYSAKTGTLYRPEKPVLYPESDHAELQQILQRSSQTQTAPAAQSRVLLDVPIVYH